MILLEILKNILKKGIRRSTGKPFDPRNQERTDAMTDFLHPRKKEEKKNGNTK